MKRLLRILFGGFAAISLLLCIGVAVFWVGSYRASFSRVFGQPHPDIIRDKIRESGDLSLVLASGRITVSWSQFAIETDLTDFAMGPDLLPSDLTRGAGVDESTERGGIGTPEQRPHRLMRRWRSASRQVITDRAIFKMVHTIPLPSPFVGNAWAGDWEVVIPCWALFVATGLIPSCWIALAAIRRRRLRSKGAGQCVVCGYDLRATPLRCPECGTAHSVTMLL